jgi:predicted enzyme related to lactoylglutathione lyase
MAHRSRLAGFIIDCQGDALAGASRFWSRALGLAIVDPDEAGEGRYARLAEGPGGLHIEVQAVDHPSRVHLDIETDDLDAEVARLTALGAVEVSRPRAGRWVVMQAPTGQRFCVVRMHHPERGAAATTWD